jgi:hypothetical protein
MDNNIENKIEHFERKKSNIMSFMKKIFTVIFFLLFAITLWANGDQKTNMADAMRSNGRIYVVVAVMLTILIGLLLYLVRLDRKIRKMEK